MSVTLGPSCMFPAWNSGPWCSQWSPCWSHGFGEGADADLLPNVCPDGDRPESRDCPLQHAPGQHPRHWCEGGVETQSPIYSTYLVKLA